MPLKMCVLALLIAVLGEGVAQKQATNWYFGSYSGVSFASGSPVSITSSNMDQYEGCATISNAQGRLLFYTDGVTVWDSTQNVMSNGSNLNGHWSASQSSVVIPKPGTSNIYYIFTTDAQENNCAKGLQYSEVNMSQNSGKGAVTSTKNVQLEAYTSEKITAVAHANGTDYWVLTYKRLTDTVLAFQVTNSGVSTTPVKSNIRHSTSTLWGYMKFSPDGKFIAIANGTDSVLLGSFDNSTGQVSKVMGIDKLGATYGVEFSPKGKYLYCGDYFSSDIFQYDIRSGVRSTIRSSKVSIVSGLSGFAIGALQLGPDLKIYSSISFQTSLNVINYPDSPGTKCNYVKNAVSLSGECRLGLPTFIQSLFRSNSFEYTRNCTRDTTFFSLLNENVDSVKWDFGDNSSGADNYSTQVDNVYHRYNKTGAYLVTLFSFFPANKDTSRRYVYISDSKPDLGRDTFQCGPVVFMGLRPQKNFKTYKWSTGKTSANIVATNKGTYTLTTLDTTGCISADTIVVMNPRIHASFALSDTIACQKTPVKFTNSTTYTDDSWKRTVYTFPDNSSITDSTAYKVFNKVDSLVIRMKTYSKLGCVDSTTRVLRTLPNANIGFTINKDKQCLKGNRYNFTSTSSVPTGSIVAYSWDLGDDSSGVADHIVNKVYHFADTFEISLATVTDRGCRDTLAKQAIVYANPVAGFNIDRDRQCYRNNIFNFANSSVISKGNISTNDWQAGDGRNFGTKDISGLSYTSEDTFTVSLVNISDMGCRDTITRIVVTYPQPMARFSIPNDSQCWQHNYFSINNQTQIKHGQLTSRWNFGDGTFDTAFQPSTKAYANNSAQYIIFYKTVSEHGCSDSAFHRVTLLERPLADFTINDSVQCFKSHLFKFADISTFSVMNTLTYYWDYGNGTRSTGRNAMDMQYNNAVYYQVSLVAYSSLTNCYDTIVKPVLPAPHAQPAFTEDKDSQCFRNNNFSFINHSSLTMGTMTYRWDFGDGTGSPLMDPVKHYVSGASYSIRLVATTNYGCSDSVNGKIILVPHPKASFTVNDTAQCINDHAFNLGNTTTVAYGSYSAHWLFDDGKDDNNRDVNNKQFSLPGFHRATLCVNSGLGCTDTISREIYLEKTGNTGISIAGKDSQCLAGNLFDFTGSSNSSNVSFVSYAWDFADGKGSTVNGASHHYTSQGIYKIQLATLSANGCRDTAFISALIFSNPKSAFNVNSPCLPEAAVFVNQSGITQGQISSYQWDFGDNSTSVITDPVKYYSNGGKYTVRLISTSADGCSDTAIVVQAVWVRNTPKADFTYERIESGLFEKSRVGFRNLSSTDAVSYQWDFGNSTGSTERDPIVDYDDTARKKVTLYVSNSDNCRDTFSLVTGQLIPDFFFFMPNAFNPGSSHGNHVLKPATSRYVYRYTMEIFNRWGEKIFVTNDINQGWDGTFMGEDCQQDIYLCRIYVVPLWGKMQHHELMVTLLR